jgi:hypothetical protein
MNYRAVSTIETNEGLTLRGIKIALRIIIDIKALKDAIPKVEAK